jgi:hypothetical protein
MAIANQLIDTITSNPNSSDDGMLANQLLREFHRGYPVDALRPLLESSNEKIVRAAAFIASELGSKARPLLDAVVNLLNHKNKFIRADAICSILTCTRADDINEIGKVILLLDDSDWPIRWKVMEFLSLASPDQLEGGLKYFEMVEGYPDHTSGLKWLLSAGSGKPDEIMSWIEDTSAVRRKFGTIAAARKPYKNTALLDLAILSGDHDIKTFGDSMKNMIKP